MKLTRLLLFIFVCLGSSAYPADLAALRAQVEQTPRSETAEFRLAQALYASQDFASYFAVAQWTRLKLWPSFDSVQRDKWSALELLALARHCQWTEVDALAADVERGPQIEAALSAIAVKEEYKSYRRDPKLQTFSRSKQWAQSQSLWGVPSAEFARFENPLALKVKVRTQCRAGS